MNDDDIDEARKTQGFFDDKKSPLNKREYPPKFTLKRIIIYSLPIFFICIIIIVVVFFLIKKESDIICEPGYFIPDDDPKKDKCQKCSVQNCEKCYGTKTSNFCSSCFPKYFSVIINDIITECENICETGEYEKCLTCNNETNKCLGCNPCFKLVDGKCEPDYFYKSCISY